MRQQPMELWQAPQQSRWHVVGSKPVRYLNVEMNALKDIIAQMQAGETWFGSDVGLSSNRKVWDHGS